MGSEQDPRAPTPFSPVKELFSQLRSSFFETEFQRLEKVLVEHEEHTKEKYAELETKTKSLEKEKDFLFSQNLKLKEELQKKQKESDALRKEHREYLNRKVSENRELADELKKKQSEIDEMKKVNGEYQTREAEFRAYKKQFLGLGARLSSLEKTAQELVGSDETPLINRQQKTRDAESSKPPLFGKKGDPTKRTEPKSQEIIQIDDDDDDDDNEDDIKCISTLKRKRVSYEIKQECNDDKPVACSVGSKPCLTKVERKHNFMSSLDGSESDSGSDDENVDEVYKSIIARKKTQKEVKEK